METIFEGLEVPNLDEEISKKAGKIRAKHNVDLIDAIIAATAKHYQLPLATLNTKHFKQVRGLKLITEF